MKDYIIQADESRIQFGAALGLSRPAGCVVIAERAEESPRLSPRDRVAPHEKLYCRLALRSSHLPWIKRNRGAYLHIDSQ